MKRIFGQLLLAGAMMAGDSLPMYENNSTVSKQSKRLKGKRMGLNQRQKRIRARRANQFS